MEQTDCIIEALSFGDNMAYAVRSYLKLVNLIPWLVVKFYFIDVRIRSIIICLRFIITCI